MAIYVIGDVHGCYSSLKELVKKIDFNPKKDTLWFVGDIINRGPESLKCLKYVKKLGKSAKMVLGNHELHLLASYAGVKKYQSRSDTLQEILNHSDVS
ncbi:MAG TPA: symmetrical bis(5'-nucleosyl)-tetraphosphatase, partial [Thiomicrospira sp.]|nr:symmetrical bis(5'-nucleosyl)-tetraphosphatase [Thiomicrospira sp.]